MLHFIYVLIAFIWQFLNCSMSYWSRIRTKKLFSELFTFIETSSNIIRTLFQFFKVNFTVLQ